MTVSADTLRPAYVSEAVRGTAPANPVWQVMRTTGEGLTFNPTATNSNETDASRSVRDSILTGGEVSGDINFELSFNTPFMNLLEAAFAHDRGDIPAGVTGGNNETGADDNTTRVWGADDLFVGSEIKTFTFEKRFTADDGSFLFHRYNGCLINTFSLTIAPKEPINGSFGVIGSGLTLATTQIAGSTYPDPGSAPVFTALKVTDLSLYGESQGDMRFQDYCFNGVTINLNNNARRTDCIGPDTLAQAVLGRCEITWDTNIYFSDNKIQAYLQTQDDVAIVANLRDTDVPPHKFVFRSGRCKTQSGSAVASGTGQDVIANATFAALIPDSSGSSEAQGPMTVSRQTLP